MAIQALLGSVARSYLVGLASGKSLMQSATRGRVGDYNALALLERGGYKATLELPDFVALEKEIRKLGPDLQKQFRTGAKKLGEPTKKEVRKAFKKIGSRGPLGPRKVNASKPWATPERNARRRYDGFYTGIGKKAWQPAYAAINRNSGIDVQYKSRKDNQAMAKVPRGQDGTISVVRVRVRKGPLIIADMAGRSQNSMYAKGAYRTAPYKINLYGRKEITRTHRINAENSQLFIENLRRAREALANPRGRNGASRYAYPTAEKFMPTYRRNAQTLIDSTVAEINRRLGTTNV